MNLNTIEEVRQATAVQDGDAAWQDGDSWLAGGTWLYSEPQPSLRRLFDLRALAWPSLEVSDAGLRIGATCTIAELYAFAAPAAWSAAPLIGDCCRAYLSSFKIWNTATVGGNIVMSLPAGPMISLTTSLEGVYTMRALDGSERQVPAIDFVTGNHQNILQRGELLRAIDLPASALRKDCRTDPICSASESSRAPSALSASTTEDDRKMCWSSGKACNASMIAAFSSSLARHEKCAACRRSSFR